VRALFLLLITAIIKKLIAPFVKRKDPVSRTEIDVDTYIDRYNYIYTCIDQRYIHTMHESLTSNLAYVCLCLCVSRTC
jgi:hypothetical protein